MYDQWIEQTSAIRRRMKLGRIGVDVQDEDPGGHLLMH